MKTNYSVIEKNMKQGKKMLCVLIDPDKFNAEVIKTCNSAKVDFLLVGGSLITNGNFEKTIESIKRISKIPAIIFPGNNLQISNKADGIFLLSLISGRNPEMLIGKHVIAAPQLKKSALEIIPTGYMLIESGKQTSASYMSNTTPIPADKKDIAACTAMAGEMLGMKLIYMDGGSGADNTVSEKMISEVKKHITIPLAVGGGINSEKAAKAILNSGADMIIVGTAAEKNPAIINKIAKLVQSF